MPVYPSSREEDIREKVDSMEKAAASYKPEEKAFRAQIKAQQLYGGDVVVESTGVSVGLPQSEAWMCAMTLEPDLVRHYVNLKADMAEKNVEFLSGFGFRYFFGGHDFASASGPFYSTRMFNDLLLPGLRRVSAACRKHECRHLFASDGNLWPVAGPLFVDSGIDAYYEIDRQAGMGLVQLRKKYPGLTLLGNISSLTLSRGSADDVRKEVSSCLQAAKEWGGIIVGVSNYIMPETPPENIDAMLDILAGR